MLTYHTTSVFPVSTRKKMNLPTYTLNLRPITPPIICQATGRVIKPPNPYITPCPPFEQPPFHILPCRPILHPFQPPIVLLVHVALKNESTCEKKPNSRRVSFYVAPSETSLDTSFETLSNTSFETLSDTSSETPSDISILLCEPYKPVPKNTFLEHTHLECSGNCSRHPLMTPMVHKMMNGRRGWGDMMYEEEEKRRKKIDRF